MSEPPLTWAFPCPNPTCDSELVVLPEQAGRTVECPTCGFRFEAPRVVSAKLAARIRREEREAALRPRAEALGRASQGDRGAADTLDALARQADGPGRQAPQTPAPAEALERARAAQGGDRPQRPADALAAMASAPGAPKAPAIPPKGRTDRPRKAGVPPRERPERPNTPAAPPSQQRTHPKARLSPQKARQPAVAPAQTPGPGHKLREFESGAAAPWPWSRRRAQAQAGPEPRSHQGRRQAPRADLIVPAAAPEPDEPPVKGPWAGVLLVWMVALVAAGTVVVAAAALELPDLSLVAALFLALAVVRTVLAFRHRERPPNRQP